MSSWFKEEKVVLPPPPERNPIKANLQMVLQLATDYLKKGEKGEQTEFPKAAERYEEALDIVKTHEKSVRNCFKISNLVIVNFWFFL